MAVLPLRFAGDAVLRQKTHAIRKISDASVQRLIDDMIETMHDAHGVGLAAPQIGQSLRIAIVGVAEEEIIVLINPRVVRRSGERRIEEACLSVPGYFAEITRSEAVTVKALDREGRPFRVKARDDLLAQALEHEMDHLNGVLYIDHLDSPDQLRRIEAREEAAVADE